MWRQPPSKGGPTINASTPNRPTRQLHRPLRCRAVLLGIAGALVVIAIPAVAQAASRSGVTIQGRHGVEGNSKARSSSICKKVSAASVSSIIGYKVPAGTPYTRSIKPTKENYGISGTETTCTYGAETSMATILKAVTLSFETISKPLTPSEMQQSIAKASTLAKFKFSAYSGLGVPAFYFSLTESGITGQGITGVLGGTSYFGASVESKKVSKSSLAALAKLAEKL
jgi:hypothetical protein